MFIWTFEGVIQAVALGVMSLWLGLWGIACLIEKIKSKIGKDKP